jgi:small subunit ribosomal protein S15
MQDEAKKTVAGFARHAKDNGSPEFQVATLTHEIIELQAHLKLHDKDVDAKRSLLKKVARRRKFLRYLKEHAIEAYTMIVKKLGLKG